MQGEWWGSGPGDRDQSQFFIQNFRDAHPLSEVSDNDVLVAELTRAFLG